MRGTSGTATAKAFILASVPIGAAGFLVPDAWAVASIVTSLTVLAAGGGLWWASWRRARRWAHLHRTGDARTVGGAVGTTTAPPGVAEEEDLTGPVFVERRRPRRYRLMLSATSRVRRATARRAGGSAPSPDGDQLTLVAQNLTHLEGLISSGQERSRREQVWWLIAGLAASIPIGVAINLITG
ncbi:hypothetical protein V6U81_01195 [Micromonospora sp. CPCC 205711]|uniref:hypothetical protein n=1 Tax=Micromonospora sp. CPCC 205547 TaxID=3122400 RepID=UPI002FF242AF